MSGITLDLTHAFYAGVGSSLDVPALYDVALNGRGYMLDTNHPAFGGQSAYLGRMGTRTIPLIRQQADNSPEPGEAALNPEDLWSRAQTTWHKGAGQQYLDTDDGDRARFHSSLGIDPWTRGQLGLLHKATPGATTTNTNQQLLRVGDYIYRSFGYVLTHAPATAPYITWTDATIQNGETAQLVRSIATDGYYVFAALGSNGIHQTTRGATTSTHYSDLSATLVAYVKGRLMAANGNVIYNVIASGTAPAALFTHPNTDFTWVGFTEGIGHIYAAGYSGDRTLIYRMAVKADGTSLDQPVIAGELPHGEIVRSIIGYLGFLIVGTDDGFRLATQDSSGNLTFGALVRTGSSCHAFEPQHNFVWFGWDNYDVSRTGLGRMDLTIETDAGAPAYATDLMAGTDGAIVQGAVLSICTDANGKRLFVVSGKGFYSEDSGYVDSGTLNSGVISYGLPDPKIALRVALKHKPLPSGGSVGVSVTPDDGTLVLIGTSNLEGSTSLDDPMKVPEVVAQQFEIHVTLAGDGTTLERYDFRSYPTSSRGKEVLVPLLLHEKVLTANGTERAVDVREEYNAIDAYVGIKRLVSYQELGSTYSAFVEETNFQRHHATHDRSWWNGTLLLKLKVLGD